MAKKSLKFYDVKGKKSFTTSKYDTETKMVKGNKRKFAKTKAPSGITAYRIL